MSTAAEESKEAERNLPKAIILSLAIAMVLYLLAATVLTGMVPFADLSATAAYSEAFVGRAGRVLQGGRGRGDRRDRHRAVLLHLGASRVWFAISRDGLLPAWFAKTNDHHSPSRPVWIVGIVSARHRGLRLDRRRRGADQHRDPARLRGRLRRGHRVALPLARPPAHLPHAADALHPLLGIAFSLWLVTKLQPATWVRFAVWFLLGVVIYAAYGYRHKARPGVAVQTKDTA